MPPQENKATMKIPWVRSAISIHSGVWRSGVPSAMLAVSRLVQVEFLSHLYASFFFSFFVFSFFGGGGIAPLSIGAELAIPTPASTVMRISQLNGALSTWAARSFTAAIVPLLLNVTSLHRKQYGGIGNRGCVGQHITCAAE